MRFESNAQDGQDRLPTFFQWCKANKEEKTANRYYVTKVWMPNKFPDLTLETESFRLRVNHKSPLFAELGNVLSRLSHEDAAIALCEIDKETYDFTLEVVEGEQCDWEPLGETGYRLTVREKKSRRKTKQTPDSA